MTAELKDEVLEAFGCKWKVRYALNKTEATEQIAFARVSGSVGGKKTVNGTLVADVVQLNEDGTERQPS